LLLKEICSIIQTYMELAPGSVYLRNEKINQTKMQDFNITVGFMGQKQIGSTTRCVDGIEEVALTMTGSVVIEIYGRTFLVVERKEEILMALCSSLSKETQTAKGFLIAQIPSSFNDISQIDGAAIPYRFQATFNVQFIKTKQKSVDYYTTIRNEVKNAT